MRQHTEVPNLGGVTALPGFVETHNHPLFYGTGIGLVGGRAELPAYQRAIQSGRLGDITVLPGGPTTVQPEQIRNLAVEATIIGGKVVWRRTPAPTVR